MPFHTDAKKASEEMESEIKANNKWSIDYIDYNGEHEIFELYDQHRICLAKIKLTDIGVINNLGEDIYHIVKCVNMHDELLEALEVALDESEMSGKPWRGKAIAAIAKAKGQL